MNPKDKQWKSTKYRNYINTMDCYFCGVPLREYGNKEPHHHKHSGGLRPSDQLLTNLCLKCHNEFHANESRFNERNEMSEYNWLDICINNLSGYLETLNINPKWVIINALQSEIENHE